jgi:hypothetical protein
MNIVAIAGLTLALTACVSSEQRINRHVAADHQTCASQAQPGSAGYETCREQLIIVRRKEAEKRSPGPEESLGSIR